MRSSFNIRCFIELLTIKRKQTESEKLLNSNERGKTTLKFMKLECNSAAHDYVGIARHPKMLLVQLLAHRESENLLIVWSNSQLRAWRSGSTWSSLNCCFQILFITQRSRKINNELSRKASKAEETFILFSPTALSKRESKVLIAKINIEGVVESITCFHCLSGRQDSK